MNSVDAIAQNLPASAMFTLVNFYFIFHKTYCMNNAYASKFLNKKKLNKNSNDYMGLIIQVFLSFFSFFSMRRVCVHYLCAPYQFSLIKL